MDKKKIDEKKLDEVSGGANGNIPVAALCHACGYKGNHMAAPSNIYRCPKCGAWGKEYLFRPIIC